jgi:transposase
MQVATIGLDLAKTVFQVHGVDAEGKVVIQRQLRRTQMIDFFRKLPPCLIGMEACATAHYWARELTALGHTVRLMPPSYVKAYVRRSKNDAADAAAICEAVTRPSMRFVPVKTIDQQAALALHRTRDLLVRQRTQLINALRAHLAELGIVSAAGLDGMKTLLEIVTDPTKGKQLPAAMKTALQPIAHQIEALGEQISQLERAIHAQHRASDVSRRLETIPGISKQGDRYLRRLLIVGATAVIRHAETHPEKHPWLITLLARKPRKLAAVALANKIVRIVWVLLVKGGTYRTPSLAAAA